MKCCLLPCVILLSCTPENEARQTASQPAAIDPVQQATARVDTALMHDYELALTNMRKANFAPLLLMADDTTFLRRACIDLAGRLPRPDEVRAFVSDPTPEKRAKLTDSLTREPGGAEVRFRMLAEAFRVTDEDPETISWLRQAAADDRPYAEIISGMIGTGRVSRRDGGDAMRTGVETAYNVLGLDTRCAMCHDPPFSERTEMECYAFAACFAGKGEVRLPHDYKYPNGKPGDVVQPALLRIDRAWRPFIQDNEDKLTQVARWLTNEEPTKRFVLVAVMRVWSGLFGMPEQIINNTVGGVDDEPSWNETHGNCFTRSQRGAATWIDMNINRPGDFSQAPKVLIEEFLRCGCRIGEFQRLLARTNAYQRSGINYNTDWQDCQLAPAPHIRRLPTEVIWKALTDETDIQLPQIPQPGHPLRMLGRGTREWTDESRTPLSHELVRFMMNDKLIDQATAKAGDAEGMFLALLGREPTENERAAILRTAATDGEVAWALLNTKEFMFRP
jgi:hypothetical protein